MEIIILEGTLKTPTIEFNPFEGYLLIKGRSIPENSIEFYQPLIEELENYFITPQPTTKVDIQLEYFNTSSSKCILDVLKKIEVISESSKVNINWFYEEYDEDMLEAGEDYQAIVNIPFTMIEISE